MANTNNMVSRSYDLRRLLTVRSGHIPRTRISFESARARARVCIENTGKMVNVDSVAFNIYNPS